MHKIQLCAADWKLENRPQKPVAQNTTIGVTYWWPSQDLWLGAIMVMASDLQLRGHRFNSQPLHRQVTTLGKLFTHMSLCHQAA